MSGGRCPITEEERPYAEALGRMLRSLRDEAAMTQSQLGALATLQSSSVSAIERGRRRTRRSTLERLVAVLLPEQRREAIIDELVEVAGPALAPESDWAERVARRRERRERRELPKTIAALKDALVSSRRMARLYPEGHDRHESMAELLAAEDRHLADLETKAADLAQRPPSGAGRGPRPDPRRPAWSAYQAYAHEVFGGRTGMISLSSIAPDVRARLDELKAEATAEAEAST